MNTYQAERRSNAAKYWLGAKLAALVLAATALSGAQPASPAPHALKLTGDYRGTHDPSIIKAGDTYYVFATGTAYAPAPDSPATQGDAPAAAPVPAVGDSNDHSTRRARVAIGQLPIRCSHDLLAWKRCGQVFDAIPQWIKELSPTTKELWAPDISYFDQLYHLYYAYSAFGVNSSGIALATNTTLDSTSPAYKWIDRGLVLKSTQQDDYNAIDPNLSIDEDGQAWLAFGSFWSGIKMRRLDRKTGLASSTDTRIYSLATRARPADAAPAKPGLPPDWEAIEAPFIIRHGNYFYLFVSWDLCCRGTKSSYRVMVGRSRRITGPFVDEAGARMIDGGGSPVLTANTAWVGPGGQSLLKLPKAYVIVFHAYDAKTGSPALHISTVGWKNGWPSAQLEGDGD